MKWLILFILSVFFVGCVPDKKTNSTSSSNSATTATGTVLQYYRGDKTFQTLNTSAVVENTNLYFTNSRVLGVSLIGINSGLVGTINSSDTVLSAFGKTQKQINDLSSGAGSQWTTVGADIRFPTGNVLLDGRVRFKDSGSNYVEIKAPTTVSTSYALSFPGAAGNAGQLLTTSGSGQLTWSTLPTCNAGEVLKSNGSTFSCVTDNAGSGSFAGTASRVVVTDGSGVLSSSVITSTELGYLAGVTSGVQAQINAKLPTSTFVDWSIAGVQALDPTRLNLTTANRIVATNATGVPVASAVTSTELGYLTGVTSSIQNQLNNKLAATLPTCNAGEVLKSNGSVFSCVTDNTGAGAFSGTASRVIASDGAGALSASAVTATELSYLSGVTSAIQTQINAKLQTSTFVDWSIAGVQALDPSRLNLTTASRVVATNGTGVPVASAVTSTELGYLTGVTSAIQTQLNAKLTSETDPSVVAFAKSALPTCNAGEVLKSNGTVFSCVTDNTGSGAFSGTASRVIASDGAGALSASAVTATELSYLSLVTSPIQAQINAKLPTSTFVDWSIAGVQTLEPTRLNLTTASRVVATNGTGVPVASAVTSTELGYLTGVTSAIQTQLNAKLTATLPTCNAGEVLKSNGSTFSCVTDNAGSGAFSGTASRVIASDGAGALSASSVTATELSYLTGVTSAIQTQLNAKLTSETDPSVVAFAKSALPTCNAGEVLKSNGTVFSCVTDNAGSGAFSGTASRVIASDGAGALSASAVTATELSYLSGVTSAIQTQINAKLPTSTFVDWSIAGVQTLEPTRLNLTTASRVVATNGTGVPVASAVTSTELGYLTGVTSAIQTQLDAKLTATLPTCNAGEVLKSNGSVLSCVTDNAGSGTFSGTASRVIASDGAGALSASAVTTTELNYLSLVTSPIQSQINAKLPTSTFIDWTTAGIQTIDPARLSLGVGSVSKALVTDGSGFLIASAATAAELGYLSGVTSSIQAQIDAISGGGSQWSGGGSLIYFNPANAKVGIGTSIPTSPLEVVGGILSTGSDAHVEVNGGSAVQPVMILTTTDANALGGGGLLFFATSSGPKYPLINDTLGTIIFGNNNEEMTATISAVATETHSLTGTGGQIIFSTNENGTVSSPEPRMMIDHNGNIGIGISSTANKLEVDGNVGISGNLVVAGSITGYTVSTPSDKRFKNNVEIVKDPVLKLLGLRGVTYNWIDTKKYDNKKHYGFLAQEVEKILPELVITDSAGFKSIEYANITSVLVEAFKEFYNKYLISSELQNRKIASIHQEVKELKSENKMLKEYLCKKDKSAPFCIRK